MYVSLHCSNRSALSNWAQASMSALMRRCVSVSEDLAFLGPTWGREGADKTEGRTTRVERDANENEKGNGNKHKRNRAKL